VTRGHRLRAADAASRTCGGPSAGESLEQLAQSLRPFDGHERVKRGRGEVRVVLRQSKLAQRGKRTPLALLAEDARRDHPPLDQRVRERPEQLIGVHRPGRWLDRIAAMSALPRSRVVGAVAMPAIVDHASAHLACICNVRCAWN
jgi:hypothetical protein